MSQQTQLPAAPCAASSEDEPGGGITIHQNKVAKQTWNIAPEEVAQVTRNYDADARDLLRWFYNWAIISRPAKSIQEAAEAVDVDRTTIYRVYKGSYGKDGVGVQTIPNKLLTGIAKLRRIDELRREEGRVPFIHTGTTRRIFTVLERTLERGRVCMIYADSQFGKTTALKEFKRTHNHGQTKYICLAPGGGVHELMRALSLECGISPKSSMAELKDRIIAALDRHNLLIVDEIHQAAMTYQRRSKLTVIEILRWIHDQSGCGLALVGTNVWKDMLERDRDSAALDQVARRGAIKLQLPREIPESDLTEFYKAFNLPSPEGDMKKMMRAIANRSGLTVFTETLAFGQRQAKKRGEDWPTWDDVEDAIETLKALENGDVGR